MPTWPTKWKQHGVEVILVSLDETVQEFESFASGFPFISVTDFQKWDSPIVKNYHIFATPTMYLLNKDLEIILRPNSVQQMDSWGGLVPGTEKKQQFIT